MARIMKVRTIPRGYVQMKDMEVTDKHTPSEWFMVLYNLLGNPQEGGMWSYLIRHNNIVMRVTAKDYSTMEYMVWVAPGFVLDAKRKKVKAMNVIARRLNEKGVVFIPDNEDSLYYAVRKKNEELLAKNPMSSREIKKKMDVEMTDREKDVLYGSLTQFMDDAKEIIKETIDEINGD